MNKTIWFGEFMIPLESLPDAKLHHSKKEVREEIKKSIETDGLINPLELCWDLNGNRLIFARGNQRVDVLRDLGVSEARCYLRVTYNEHQAPLLEFLKQIITWIREVDGDSIKTAVPYKEV